jgi:DNA-binding PadR family transcriptional regulator
MGPPGDDFKHAFGEFGFRTGFLKLSILRIIAERPMHGYALMKEIERITEHSWRPSPGSIYPALRDLEASGLITLNIQGRKRIYQITPYGRIILDQTIAHVHDALKHLENLLAYKPEEL